MNDYKPTEYIVDFGDYRSNRFVELSMSLIEQNGAKLGERIVRCRDCEHRVHYWHHDCERWQCAHEMLEGLDVSPGFFCACGEQVSTCRNESAVGFLCSSCSFGDFGSFKFEPNYCPICGAKVTPKNSETTPKVVGE